jgi:hypothetical protein
MPMSHMSHAYLKYVPLAYAALALVWHTKYACDICDIGILVHLFNIIPNLHI